jgi:hypothetical protein
MMSREAAAFEIAQHVSAGKEALRNAPSPFWDDTVAPARSNFEIAELYLTADG